MFRMSPSTSPVLAIVIAGLLLGGCSSTERDTTSGIVLTMDARQDPMLFSPDGGAMTYDEALALASGADVVIIGETHGHPLGLEFGAALFEDLVELKPDASLSLEFIERDHQVALDDYLAGLIDEATFNERTRRTPGNYPPGHARMVEIAKSAGLPVAASNAPRRYVRLARTDGFDRLRDLAPAQQDLVRIPDPQPGGRYRDDFFELMGRMSGGSHGAPHGEQPVDQNAMIEAIFRAQTVWDATMADAVGDHLDRNRSPVVHVVGRFHSDFEGGTVQLIRRRHPDARIVTISVVDAPDAILRSEDEGRADIIAYVGPGPS